VVKLADTPDLGSGAARLGGSSPFTRTFSLKSSFYIPASAEKRQYMPTVTRENIGLLNDKITVTVNKEDYLPSFEKVLKDYAKKATIPGFRKGMVPTGVIRKMHGPAVFTEEVLRSVEQHLTNFLRTEKLDIFGQPLAAAEFAADEIKLNDPKEYSFAFEVGLKPEFELPDLATARTTRYKVEITDEMLNDELDRLQNRLGKMTEPETVANEDHVVNVRFEASDAEGNVAEGTTPKENSLLVKYFSPAYREKLIGAKNEDSFVIQLKTAFEEKEREWLISDLGLNKDDETAIEQYFKMTITKVGLIEKRELNEEFFEEAYPGKGIKTEEELKAEIKSELQQHWDRQSRNHLQHEIYHVLLEQTQMEFPETFLKRWLLTGGEEQKTEEQVEHDFPTFRNQLRWTLVTDKIVKEQNLNVSREEVVDAMRQQVMSYFGQMNMGGGNMEWLDQYIDRMMKDEQQVDSTYRRLITEKIFEWAETRVNPEEKPISTEDFMKLQQAHQHEH
jgi:trigger factor